MDPTLNVMMISVPYVTLRRHGQSDRSLHLISGGFQNFVSLLTMLKTLTKSNFTST